MTAAGPFRCEVRNRDVEAVRALLSATGFFRREEVAIGGELVAERLARGAASGYGFLFADDEEGRLAGYACYGPVPLTVGSFDLYWIAVAPAAQRRGLGRALLAAAEVSVTAAGGRRLWVDTSTREQYAPTRAFYERAGYRLAAELEDFYAPGDGKAIFCKTL